MRNKTPFWMAAAVIILMAGSCSGKKGEEPRTPSPGRQGPGAREQAAVRSPGASGEWQPVFIFVRDAIRTEPSRFPLKTAEGIEWGRSGNSLEKALFLARLLNEKGMAVELAEGELDDAAAKTLLGGIFPPGKTYSYKSDVPISTPAADPDLVAAAKRHFWVRVKDGENRVDLDPSFPAAEPGEVYTAVRKTYDPTDGSLSPRVSMALEYTEGNPGQPRSVLAWEGPMGEVANRPLSLLVLAEFTQGASTVQKGQEQGTGGGVSGLFGGLGGQGAGNKKSQAGGEKAAYNAVLSVGGKELAGGRIATGAGTPARLGLRIKIESLGEVVSESERVLFETTAKKPDTLLFQRHAILITGNRVPAEAWKDSVVAAADKDRLAGVKTQADEIRASLKAKKFSRDTLATGARIEEKIGPELGHLVNMIFASTSDDQTEKAGAALSVASWYALPRILITTFSGGRNATATSIDLRQDRVEAMALPGQAARMKEAFLYGRGVMESVLEGKLLGLFAGKPALTTAALMREAARRKIPIRMFSALEKDSLKKLGAPANVVRLVSAALDAGRIVVMPARGVAWEGRVRWGWWDIEPWTRDTIGVLDTGLHQAMLEKTILESEGPLQSKMGAVLGAMVGAIDTYWVLSAMVLKYGELTKEAVAEAKAYMKEIQSVMCPGFEDKIEFSVSITTVDIEDCFKHEIELGKVDAGVSIKQGWCENFAKGFACASTSILNYYLSQFEE